MGVGRVLGALDGNTEGPNLRCLSTFSVFSVPP